MKNVKLNKKELLTILKENKTKHVEEFKESVTDYKTAVIKLAKENLKIANSGDLNEIARIRTIPRGPVSYEDNYTRAIRMLELSVDDVIELEEDVFNQLVLDEWHWKQAFTTTSALYKTL